MGSSKKHKDKDRDRESKKRRHRSKSRSRSRSKERHGQRERKEKRDRIDVERDRKRPRGVSYGGHNEESSHRTRLKEERQDPGNEVRHKSSSSGDSSLTIEETNRLRARLGLKPLEVKTETGDSSKNQEGENGKKEEFVHKPAENLADKLCVEKLREKIAAQKEKRKIQEKLRKVKGLAGSDSDDDSAFAWIEKSRKLQIEKDKAQKRAKLLEEMDQEFGISNLVEDEFKAEARKAYCGKDLRGLVVEHSKEKFADGKEIVLTLKDKAILDDDDDDVLVNVNIIDEEKAEKNIDLRKKKPGYDAYDETEDGMGIKKSVLKKYDEEIEGLKRDQFRIGARGEVDISPEAELLEIRKKLALRNTESLSTSYPTLATEYYTEEEMVKFKKPKNVRKKVRKPKRLKADELSNMILPVTTVEDYGSRRRGRGRKDEYFPIDSDDIQDRVEDMEIERSSDVDEPDILGPDEDLTGIAVEPDEAADELQFVLNKERKLKQKEELGAGFQKLLTKIKLEAEEESKAATSVPVSTKGSIVMNATAEFCRALGDIPTYGLSGNRDEDVEDLLEFERDLQEERRKMEEDARLGMGAWNEVGIDEKPVEIKKEDAPILEEEPDVSVGVAGALKLAMKKGYLDKESKKVVSAPRHSQLQAASYTIEDKNFVEDDKYGRRDRYCAGPVSDFKERDAYKPDVKLEYIDDNGRLLSPKEAFRYLSHKFHGKGSGKNKTEKRMKKLQEEALMRQMSSTDTPLGTLNLLQEKQKQTQSPYILLSGGSKALNPNTISKPT